MIYKGAVAVDYNSENLDDQNNARQVTNVTFKRNSSSSEDESPNMSNETINGNYIENQGDQNKILYQQFLDCRLREQREMVKQGEASGM